MRARCAKWLLAVVATVMFAACHHIDARRIPYAPVYVTFATEADWNVWGVSGAGQHRRFIKQEKVPAGYPYKATDQTGFGGLLLVTTFYGNLQCFDLACPVEAKYNVRVAIDPDTHLAKCPVCHSEYDVFEMQGYPVAGPAAQNGYGLRAYYVGRGTGIMEYMVITR